MNLHRWSITKDRLLFKQAQNRAFYCAGDLNNRFSIALSLSLLFRCHSFISQFVLNDQRQCSSPKMNARGEVHTKSTSHKNYVDHSLLNDISHGSVRMANALRALSLTLSLSLFVSRFSLTSLIIILQIVS